MVKNHSIFWKNNETKSTPLKTRDSSTGIPQANLGEKWIFHIVLARAISLLNQKLK